MSPNASILELCRLIGIETEFVDNAGISREALPATIVALLASLGYPADTPDDASASIERFHRGRASCLVEPVAVCRADESLPGTFVTLPAGAAQELVHWEVIPEVGGALRGEALFADLPLANSIALGDEIHERRRLDLPVSLDLGYHRVRIRIAETSGEGALIMAPTMAYQPPILDQGHGVWGVGIQLYGLRSERNWGIGDYTDLNTFLNSVAPAGAAAVSLNPLHALFLDDPRAASPYSPSSRLFSNPLYLDVEAIADFGECAEAQDLISGADWQIELNKSRADTLVDYAAVAARKLPVLEQLYQSFRSRHLAINDQRASEFLAYRVREGVALKRFALYHALRDNLREQGAESGGNWQSWRDWPARLRDPDAPAVAQFELDNRSKIEFFAYLQWQCEIQLAACAETASQHGMPIGLYHDLAVGVDANGAEAWADQEAIVPGWSVGAPPDPWNLKGQSWGLPPFDPVALRALAYRPLIETFRANMRHAGALRIDHILGFRRLFWIPAGAPPGDGVYVRYPVEDMLSILALESYRNRCLVIGEDLGTLPEGLRDALAERGILSYRLLYFEREHEGSFHPPEAYPRQALVAVGTHDLPTLAGYWDGSDIALKFQLGFYESDARRAQDEEQRERDRRLLGEALTRAGLLKDQDLAAGPPVEAAYRFVARAPSRLLLVHFEDALGIRDQINMPGTVFEHPNWRRRLPLSIDELFQDSRISSLQRVLQEERPTLNERDPA